ncbi:iron-siderophore ABC transporter substrate-binding protein [Tsukamurella conjunctivitidis]|uniref:Iron-siderophore ABC transporter substrate-binding protein n=3 Tax=Tsukamurellaceae TaxID=85028 RepID=A0A5C5S203_9ACTN|nr:iron-siderophore ABC transporter substrate-binding protein [Tsukamurella columbiensis]TWS28932.1 iron-siderophore ABC transporter substrate-binding protein [Tsukamurella conjunctivitidis]
MGETTVPVAPKRVVVIDSPHLDALVALGIAPVGATVSAANDGFPGYLRDRLGGTTSVGSTTTPNVEQIAALRPDLIIGSTVRHEKMYAQLSGIAPTVFSVETGTNWKEQANITADAVNRTAEMTTRLAELDARAAAVGRQVGASGTTLSIVRFRANGFRLYGPETFSGSVIAAMGFSLPQKTWGEYSMIETSLENFAEIDGDTVFYTQGANAAATTAAVTGRWGALPAVAAHRAFAVEDETWMVGIGVLGAGRIIDDVQRLVTPRA